VFDRRRQEGTGGVRGTARPPAASGLHFRSKNHGTGVMLARASTPTLAGDRDRRDLSVEVRMPAQVSYKELCKACLWLGLTAYGGPPWWAMSARRWSSGGAGSSRSDSRKVGPLPDRARRDAHAGDLVRRSAAQRPGGGRRRGGLFHFARGAHRLGRVGPLLPLARSPARPDALPRVGAVVLAILAYACLKMAKSSLPTLASALIALAACAAHLSASTHSWW